MTNNSDKKIKDSQIIQTLDKGLYLLEVIEQEYAPINLTKLVSKLKWDKATIFRLCSTLERRGYIHKDPDTKCYSLGLKIYGLYDSITRNLDIQKIIRPFLNRLVKETGETANLALVLEKSVVFIDTVRSSNVLSANVHVGEREPLHCTSLGKSFLAYIDPMEIENHLEIPLPKITPSTIVSMDELREHLVETRERGWSFENEEFIIGMCCISAPILNQFNLPIAMISISGPKYRLPLKKVREYGVFISHLAGEISQWFGYKNK